MNAERERVNLEALVRPPSITLPGGVIVRELSAGVVTLARKLDLRILSGDAEARANLSTDDMELELYAVGWLMCAAPAEAWRATRAPWETFRDVTLLPWIFALPATAITPLIEAITSRLAELGAASVEPEPRHPADPDAPPPNT